MSYKKEVILFTNASHLKQLIKHEASGRMIQYVLLFITVKRFSRF